MSNPFRRIHNTEDPTPPMSPEVVLQVIEQLVASDKIKHKALHVLWNWMQHREHTLRMQYVINTALIVSQLGLGVAVGWILWL